MFACSRPLISSDALKNWKSTFAMSVFAPKIPCMADVMAFSIIIFLKSDTPAAKTAETTTKAAMPTAVGVIAPSQERI